MPSAALTNQQATNEIFNVTHGDLFRWQHLWPDIANVFDMPDGAVEACLRLQGVGGAGPAVGEPRKAGYLPPGVSWPS
jgi:hypothetical protein